MATFKHATSRLFLLSGLIVAITFSVAAVTLYMLYATALEQTRVRLTETVQSQARLIEAISDFDQKMLLDYQGNVSDAVLEQMRLAHASYAGFGVTGEFTLAKAVGNEIIFLLSHRHTTSKSPAPVPMESHLAEPMRAALAGMSTSLIGLDYRGEVVVAATEPVNGLGWGLVAKIDLSEVQGPFVRAGLVALGLTAVLTSIGVLIFRRLSFPIIDSLREGDRERLRLSATLDSLINSFSDAIFVKDQLGRYQIANPAFCRQRGMSKEELLGADDQKLFPEEFAHRHQHDDQHVLDEGHTVTFEEEAPLVDGDVRTFLTTKGPLVVNGETHGIFAIARDISNEKRLMSDLQRFRNAINQSGDAIFLIDPKTSHFLDVNEAAHRSLGYTRDEILQLGVMDIGSLPEGINWPFHLEKIRREKALTFEGAHQRKDGTAFPVEIDVRYVFDDESDYIVADVRDITERVHAQAALEESERLFRATFDQAAVGIARTGLNGEWLEVNGKLCEILGYSRAELLRKGFQEITYPDDLENDIALMQELLSGQYESKVLEKRYIKRSGNTVWVRLTVSLVRNELGDPHYFVTVIEDIEARKQADEKLSEAAAVFRSTGEGVTITDLDGTILEVNEAFTKITGYSRDEVVGKNPRVLQSGRHDRAFYQDMWQQLLVHGQWHGEIWNRAKNGTVFPEILTISTVESERGELTGYVGVFADITSLKATEARLNHMAHYDPLTNLPNRLLFKDRLEHSLASSHRKGTHVAVIFLDLDHFKNINDAFGHIIGDQVLAEVAMRLLKTTRKGDTVGHISGDEFCLVLEDLHSAAEAVPIVEKLTSIFDAPFELDDHSLSVSASIGVSVSPDNSQEADALLSFADAAMYEAKEAGRNTYRFYTRTMTEQALEHSFVQSALRDALQVPQFYLVYQPQINLTTSDMVGLEVLLRWEHPERGLIPPGKFIPIAEQSGLIKNLGAWILNSACAQGSKWLIEERDFGRIYVNVAGPQLHDAGFPDLVKKILEEHDMPAGRLGLEVTEGFVMGASQHAIKNLLALREMGVELAIDDFGTGYSSLSYLKQLPINKLKIDQSFVRDIPSDANDRAIAEAVIVMGRALGLKVTAEGVELKEQVAFLLEKGCSEAQGYLYSQPLVAADIEAWMIHKLTQQV